MYKYQLLRQDGTVKDLGTSKKQLSFTQMYELLDCHTIELIPQAYYPDGFKGTIFGDEEGRFKSTNYRNPHTKVLNGNPSLGEPAEWDCVGNLISEEKI